MRWIKTYFGCLFVFMLGLITGHFVQYILDVLHAEELAKAQAWWKKNPLYIIPYEGGFPVKFRKAGTRPKRYKSRFPKSQRGRPKNERTRFYEMCYMEFIQKQGLTPGQAWKAAYRKYPGRFAQEELLLQADKDAFIKAMRYRQKKSPIIRGGEKNES